MAPAAPMPGRLLPACIPRQKCTSSSGHYEIGVWGAARLFGGGASREGKLKLDDSCISKPKSETLNWNALLPRAVQPEISDFGFEMQESSNFRFPTRTRDRAAQ